MLAKIVGSLKDFKVLTYLAVIVIFSTILSWFWWSVLRANLTIVVLPLVLVFGSMMLSNLLVCRLKNLSVFESTIFGVITGTIISLVVIIWPILTLLSILLRLAEQPEITTPHGSKDLGVAMIFIIISMYIGLIVISFSVILILGVTSGVISGLVINKK
jgi:hypothetical protein